MNAALLNQGLPLGCVGEMPSQSAFSLASMSQAVNRAVGKTFSGNNLCDFFYKDLRINISFPLQHGRLFLSFVHTIPDNFCSGTKIIPNRASVRT